MGNFTLAGTLTTPDGTVAASKKFRVRLVNAIDRRHGRRTAPGPVEVTTDGTGAYTVDLAATDTTGPPRSTGPRTDQAGVFSPFTFQAPAAGLTKDILELRPRRRRWPRRRWTWRRRTRTRGEHGADDGRGCCDWLRPSTSHWAALEFGRSDRRSSRRPPRRDAPGPCCSAGQSGTAGTATDGVRPVPAGRRRTHRLLLTGRGRVDDQTARPAVPDTGGHARRGNRGRTPRRDSDRVS